ncbi:DUF7507 domain-containing protein [Luteococcus sp. Sow4_B9]|uniref:DUF7507 domain-containing protein n=1 Tax=Luteococcus sp. Sow4_B9 TaxID=3438792 RepID=UPI003F9D4A69
MVTTHTPRARARITGRRPSLVLALLLGLVSSLGLLAGTLPASANTVTATGTITGGTWVLTDTTSPAVFPAAGGTITHTITIENKSGVSTDRTADILIDKANISAGCDAGSLKWADGTTTWPRAVWGGTKVVATCTQTWAANTTGKEITLKQPVTITGAKRNGVTLANLTVTQPLAQPSSTPTSTNALTGVSNGCTLTSFGVNSGSLSSVCWLATAGWDPMTIGKTTGTQTVVVPNADGTPSDWTLTYTVSFTGNDLKLTTYNSPTWSGAALGMSNYGGANIPSFYNTGTGINTSFPQMIQGGTETVTLNNLKLVNTRTGATATSGWGLVMADAESTNSQVDIPEVFKMTSNKPIQNFLGTGGSLGLYHVTDCADTGWGTTTVSCTGTGNNYTKAIVGYADAPTTAAISLTTSNYSMQGGAFGISLPNVEINKDVTGRVNPTDQFQVQVKDSASTVVAAATTTGTAVLDPATGTHQASTGPKAVLAGSYGFEELSVGGTDLTKYTQTWTCTDRSGLTTTAPTFAGATRSATLVSQGTTTVGMGQIISCTVTNTPKPRITLVKNLLRASATDQTTLSVKNGTTTLASATTTGSDTTATTTATTGVVTINPTSGTTYPAITLGETTANAAGYVTSYTCTNGTTGGTTVGSGTATSLTITPKGNDDITCTWTNIPKPRITLVKELTRNAATDQATVSFASGATVLGTTTTTGSTVGTKVTATTGIVTLAANADGSYPALSFTDVMSANAGNYTSTYQCTNTTSGGTTVALATGTSFALTPKVGDNITCTFVNTAKPALNITKKVNSVSPVAANGDFTVVYDVVAQNTGAVPATYGPIMDTPAFASNLAITKAEWSMSGSNTWTTLTGAAPYTIGTSRTLAAGTRDTYQVRITFHATTATATAADTCSATPKPGEGLFNSVTATGETGTTADNSACASVTPPTPTLDLQKKVKGVADTNGNGITDAGDVISYSFTVTNTGSVTLAPVTVTDQLLGLTDMACAASLAPGASATCDATRTWTITAADVTAGSVVNKAIATGTPPYTGTDNPPVNSPERSTVTPVAPLGRAVVTKTDATSGATLSGAVFSLFQTTSTAWDGSTPAPASDVCRTATAPGSTPVATGLTTGSDGRVTLTGMRLAGYDYAANQPTVAGSAYTVYCLVETTAPAGHELLAAPVTFTVESSTTPQQVTVTDVVHNLGNALPSTGGHGVGRGLAGLLLAALAAALVASRRHGRRA